VKYKNNIFFLSGLPRTGSTLLTSILDQNPKIQTGANSPLCQIMWDMKLSLKNSEQVINYPNLKNDLMFSIPKIFYKNKNKKIIDKCRSWTLPENINLINEYINPNFKMIVMIRPIIDIVRSIVFIRQKNQWKDPEYGLLEKDSEPIMRSLLGVLNVIDKNNDQFCFISYDALINSPKKTLDKIYDFFDWKHFNHDFLNIVNNNKENDFYLNLNGLHDIRSNISRRKIDVVLSKKTETEANKLFGLFEHIYET
jgi:sulfotransferase